MIWRLVTISVLCKHIIIRAKNMADILWVKETREKEEAGGNLIFIPNPQEGLH